MTSKLHGYPTADEEKLRRAFSEFITGGLEEGDSRFPAEVISRLESLTEEFPEEWVYWVALCDWRMRVGALADAVIAAERADDIRPNDLATTYALATAYRGLTNATYLDDIDLPPQALERMASVEIFPDRARDALQELGMTLEEAAEACIRRFLWCHQQATQADRAHIAETLAALRQLFPGSSGWDHDSTVNRPAWSPVGWAPYGGVVLLIAIVVIGLNSSRDAGAPQRAPSGIPTRGEPKDTVDPIAAAEISETKMLLARSPAWNRASEQTRELFFRALKERAWARAEAVLSRVQQGALPDAVIADCLGNLRFGQGDDQGALLAYNRAIQIEPSYAQAYWSRGSLHLNHNRHVEAIPDFEMAVALDSSNANYRLALGAAFAVTGQHMRALPHLWYAAGQEEAGMTGSTSRWFLAMAYFSAGIRDSGVAYAQFVIEHDPDSELASALQQLLDQAR